MSIGKSNGVTTSIPTLSPEQNQMIQAQTQLFGNTIAPAYKTAVEGATNLYNQSAPGVTNAAQNLAGTAAQAQNVLGSTGESALRTGISGLENLYGPQYEQQQLQAAMMPAQAQYAQNIAQQSAQFGGAGQMGSARQVENNIAQQRAAAGNSLIGAGQGGINQAVGAAGQQITASMTPQALYNQYANVLFGTPSQSWNPNFAGTQSITQTQSGNTAGIKI